MTNMSSTPIRQRTVPPLPLKVRVLVSLIAFVLQAARRPDGTVNRLLLSVVDPRFPTNPDPVGGVTTADVPVDPSRDLWFRLYLPVAAHEGGFPVIIYFHGGGFVFHSAASQAFDDICRRISSNIPAAIVSVNYRLSPEHRFPAAYDDGIDVLRFLDLKASDAGVEAALKIFFNVVDLSSCFVAGDSAGGNIAYHVTQRWAAGEATPGARLKLVGLVGIQPFFGGVNRMESEIRLEGAPFVSTEQTDWFWKSFLPVGADRDHEAANVYGPNSRSVVLGEGFPPTFVIVGGYDPLQDRQRRFCEWLKEKGKEASRVEFPNAIHGFYAFTELNESQAFVGEIRGFMEQHSGKKVVS